MVKLSRTSLGFLPLGSVALVGFTAATALAGLVAMAGLEAGAFSAAAFLAGFAALDAFGALGAVTGLDGLAALTGSAAGVIMGLGLWWQWSWQKIDKRYKQFIPFVVSPQGMSTASSQGVFCQA